MTSAFATSVALPSCTAKKPTAFLLAISTDAEPGELDEVRITLARGGATRFNRVYGPGQISLPGTLTAARDGTDGAPLEVRVEARKANAPAGGVGDDHAWTVVHDARAGFSEEKTKLLRVRLDRACFGVMCVSPQTCVDGGCIDEGVIDGNALPDAPADGQPPAGSGGRAGGSGGKAGSGGKGGDGGGSGGDSGGSSGSGASGGGGSSGSGGSGGGGSSGSGGGSGGGGGGGGGSGGSGGGSGGGGSGGSGSSGGSSSGGSSSGGSSSGGSSATSCVTATPGVQSPHPKGTTCAKLGYYDYVPTDYATAGNWPVIIAFHGDGERGDGVAELPLLLNNGLTKDIPAGKWDPKKRFVVLAPQMDDRNGKTERSGASVNDFVLFAKANYKIDVKRMYLTGLSGGGAPVYNYLGDYAGGEVAATNINAGWYSTQNKECSWKDIPIWYFHSAKDNVVVPSQHTTPSYEHLLACNPGPAVPPRYTMYANLGHSAWGPTYDLSGMDANQYPLVSAPPGTTPYDISLYDWFLQYTR